MELSFNSWIDVLISCVLMFIMFGIGLSLTFAEIKHTFMRPKAIGIGLISQMVGLPLLAFGIAILSPLPLAFKVGIVILSACPGGTTSGFVTFFFKGNVALSISLTTINSFLTLFTIPAVVNFALQHFYSHTAEIVLPFWSTLMQIFCVTIIPAFLGVLLKTNKPTWAEAIQKPLKFVMLACLGTVFLVKFFAGEQHGGTGITETEIFNILPYAILFNLVCMIFGYAAGLLSKLGAKDAFTIAIEVTLHNTTLALLVATLLKEQEMMKPALVYAMFSFATAVLFGLVVKRMNKTTFFGEFN